MRILLPLALMLTLIAASAAADVTVKSSVTSKGIVGLTNMEGTQEQQISGDMAKNTSDMKMTSKVMKLLGAGKPHQAVEIIRVDKEVFWDLNLKDKEYQERTFAEVRTEMEKALKNAQKDKAKYEKEHPEEAEKLRTEVKVASTGKSQTIAGHEAKESVITMTVYGKNSESGEAGAMVVTMDLWLAQDVPGADDFQKFSTDLAAKLGFTGQGQQSMEGMLSAFGVDPRDLYNSMKDLKGMAMMSTVTMTTTGQGSEQAGTKSEAKDEKSESSDEGGKRGMAGKLGGLLGRKKENKSEEPSKGAKPSGPPVLMEFTSTVTEISSGAVPASEFEIPQGFGKK